LYYILFPISTEVYSEYSRPSRTRTNVLGVFRHFRSNNHLLSLYLSFLSDR